MYFKNAEQVFAHLKKQEAVKKGIEVLYAWSEHYRFEDNMTKYNEVQKEIMVYRAKFYPKSKHNVKA
jgi:hypothetical protein